MEKANIPKIRFDKFNDDWEQRKLGEVATYKNGKGHEDNQSDEGTYELINLNSISIDGGLKPSGKFIEDGSDTLLENDLVMVLSDVGHGDLLGRVAIIPENNRFVLNQRVALLRINDDTNPYFLFSIINRHQDYFKKLGAGSSQLNISRGTVEDFVVDYPCQDEQRKIAKCFQNLDTLITLHQRKYEKLQMIKKSMLEKMFPQNGEKKPEIRFEGFTDDWEQRKLGEMGSTFTGLSGKTKEDFGHGEAKFITYMNVFSNPVANLEMTESVEIDTKQNSVKKGDVFFTTSSETSEEVGMSCVMPENKENIYLNSFCFGYRPTEKFDLDYLAYVLRTASFRKEMTFLAQGISRYNISKNKVMEVSIPVPNLEEQAMIGGYFSNLDHLITLHQRKLEKLRNIKKSMLEKMFV